MLFCFKRAAAVCGTFYGPSSDSRKRGGVFLNLVRRLFGISGRSDGFGEPHPPRSQLLRSLSHGTRGPKNRRVCGCADGLRSLKAHAPSDPGWFAAFPEELAARKTKRLWKRGMVFPGEACATGAASPRIFLFKKGRRRFAAVGDESPTYEPTLMQDSADWVCATPPKRSLNGAPHCLC